MAPGIAETGSRPLTSSLTRIRPGIDLPGLFDGTLSPLRNTCESNSRIDRASYSN